MKKRSERNLNVNILKRSNTVALKDCIRWRPSLEGRKLVMTLEVLDGKLWVPVKTVSSDGTEVSDGNH